MVDLSYMKVEEPGNVSYHCVCVKLAPWMSGKGQFLLAIVFESC